MKLKVEDNTVAFEARIYDSRLGRFLSLDPKWFDYPHYSPYIFAGNNPIWKIDFEGKNEVITTITNTITHTYKQTKVVGNKQEASSYRGIDVVTQTVQKTETFVDVNNKTLYTVTQTTKISVTIDEKGNIGTPVISRPNTTITFSGGGVGSVKNEANKNIPLSQTSKDFQANVKSISKYKKEHNGTSPIQQEAADNKSFNDKIEIAGDAEALIGTGVAIAGATGLIPEPTSKLATAGGLITAGVGLATQFVSKEEDPNNISHIQSTKATTTKSDVNHIITPPPIN